MRQDSDNSLLPPTNYCVQIAIGQCRFPLSQHLQFFWMFVPSLGHTLDLVLLGREAWSFQSVAPPIQLINAKQLDWAQIVADIYALNFCALSGWTFLEGKIKKQPEKREIPEQWEACKQESSQNQYETLVPHSHQRPQRESQGPGPLLVATTPARSLLSSTLGLALNPWNSQATEKLPSPSLPALVDEPCEFCCISHLSLSKSL